MAVFLEPFTSVSAYPKTKPNHYPLPRRYPSGLICLPSLFLHSTRISPKHNKAICLSSKETISLSFTLFLRLPSLPLPYRKETQTRTSPP